MERTLRRAALRRNAKRAGCIAVPTVAAVLTMSGESAWATNCTAGYMYAGQQQPAAWQGIEGYISIDSLSLGTSGSHILNFLELKNFSARVCGNDHAGPCWLQDGYGLGSLLSPCGNSGSIYAYEENNDVNGYWCTWDKSISLPQDDFWNVFYTHQTSGTNGLLDGYINTGSGPILIAQAWMPNYAANLTATATTEVSAYTSGTCPSVGSYEYFGTNGAGVSSSQYALYLSANGQTWSEWTQAPNDMTPHGPYSRGELNNYYAFKTSGS